MLPHQCRAARRGADKRLSGVADRTGAGERSSSSATALVADEAMRPIEKSQSRLIGRNAPPRVKSSRSDAILQMGFIQPVAQLRARLRQRPIVIPAEASSAQQWTINDTQWPRVKRYTSAADPTMVVESDNSLELRQTLFATQFPLEDYL